MFRKRIIRYPLYALSGLLLLIGLLFALAQTPLGKGFIASAAGRLASGDGMTVTIDGIGGFVPARMSIGQIEVADEEGTFARIEGFNLSWSPLALAGGSVSAETIAARKVTLTRLPRAKAESEPSTGFDWRLPRIAIQNLEVSEIDIAEQVFGEAMRFSLLGSMKLSDGPEGARLKIALNRHDRAGSIGGTISFVPAGRLLDVDVAANEPGGGLIANLAQIEGLPPVTLAVKGEGSLDDFNAVLSFEAGSAAHMTGKVAVRRAEAGYAIVGDATAEAARLLPGNVAPLFEGETAFSTQLHVDDAQRITIESASLRAAGFGAALTGTFAPQPGQARLRYKVIGGPAERFAGLAPGVQWQDLFLEGSVDGLLARPEAKAELTITMARAQGYEARKISANVETTPRSDGSLGLVADGGAEGLDTDDPKVKAALGDALSFALAGALDADMKPALSSATVKFTPLVAEFTGKAALDGTKGKLRLGRLDLAALSTMAGRPIAGQITADADIDVTPRSLRVTGRGSSIGVVTGVAALDGLLNAPVEISGNVYRGEDGVVVVENFDVKAKRATLKLGGRIDRALADLTANLALDDLAVIDPQMSGSATATASFSGKIDQLGLEARLAVPSASAMGKPVENLELVVDAENLTGDLSGTVTVNGRVAGNPVRGLMRVAAGPEETYRLDTMDLSVGANKLSGSVVSTAGLLDGAIEIKMPKLADLSALALTPLSGVLNGMVRLSPSEGKQSVAFDATADGLNLGEHAFGKTLVKGTVRDAFGTPAVDGEVEIAGGTAAGVKIGRAKLSAKSVGSDSTVKFDAVVAGTSITGEGQVAAGKDATSFELRTLALSKDGTRARLTEPSTFTIAGDRVAIDKFALATGKGRASISGTAGRNELGLDMDLASMPLGLARLGGYEGDLHGELTGKLKVLGTPQSPNGRYDIKITGLSNRDTVRNGLDPVDIALNGELRGGRAGIAMTIRNAQLKDAKVTGSISIPSQSLDLNARGEIALSIANAVLAASGITLSGQASVDTTVTGKLANPNVKGRVRISNARYSDAANGVVITKINGEIIGDGRTLVLRNLAGVPLNGGSLALAGRVALDPATGMPMDVTVRLDKAALVTSEMARLVADGEIRASGPALSRPKISGRVAIQRLDINLPDKLSGGAKAIEVRHVNKPGKKQANEKKRADEKRQEGGSRTGFMADLDVTLAAPSGIFVRGSGLEAELGGDLVVRGTSADPRSLGGFSIKRGRFDILGKRLDFTKGVISFNGSLDPELDFVAQTESDGVTAKVLVTGLASEPKISFASTPELPQDEVISRLLFDRGTSELTMGQAAQLAQTVAQFAGSGPGALDKVRQSLGVDSLDVDTENGGQVGIGKRLNDRIYLGVKQGAGANSSKVTIDVDITRNIRARGATGADGSTEVGIGAEWDY